MKVLSIKSILFPTDFSSCASQALEHALFLAKCFNARLHIFHAIILHERDPHNPAFHFPNLEEIRSRLGKVSRDQMGGDLEASIESEKEVDIEMKEEWGVSASNLILKYSDERNIDLIVMGTHGRRGLGYMFLGSIAQEVVRNATCPVFTVRESDTPKLPRKTNLILSPIDFSDHSIVAMMTAREFANLYDAKLQVLHVIEQTTHPAFYGISKEIVWGLRADLVDSSKKELDRIFDEFREPVVDWEFKAVAGHVVNEILDFAAQSNADLIVIATHGLSGLREFLLGSVAEKVIRKAPCPVLTVKPFGTSAS
jgi:nucleotide-binding universal stress UspA family protein